LGRARVDLNLRNDAPVPFDYQYYLASALYHKIQYSNFKLGTTIHNKAKYKQFTFSWLDIPRKEVLPHGIRILDGYANFQIASPNPEILKGFIEGLLSDPELRLGNAKFEVQKVQTNVLERLGEIETFKCLSPILVRTIREADGRRIVWDLDPHETKFFTNLHANLVRKYADYHGGGNPGRFDIQRLSNVKRTRIRIKDTYNRAYFMEFQVRGDPELMTFAYEAGLGERNSMGFGMLETV